jgi:hypothetical protein
MTLKMDAVGRLATVAAPAWWMDFGSEDGEEEPGESLWEAEISAMDADDEQFLAAEDINEDGKTG